MNYEWIQNFLSSPELPDIIAYIFVGLSFVSQMFIKRFVKKDNLFTTEKVNVKITKVNELYSKLQDSDKAHTKERKEWKEEKETLIKEINTLKKAVKLCSGNTKDLVKNGVANTIDKMLDDAVNYESSKSDAEEK